MILGAIDIDPEDNSKKIKITEDIGFNPNKRNITRINNFNMNTLKEKNNDDLEKLTIHYLELINSKKEDSHKTKKKIDSSLNNNYYENILYPEAFSEKNSTKRTVAYDGGTFLTDKINLSNFDLKGNNTIKKTVNTKDDNYNSINTNSNINNFSLKTKTVKTKNDFNIAFEAVPELKKGIPVNFDQLIVDIKDGKNKPKPINPLFFVINGDRPIDKTKFINFRTNPALFTTTMNKRNSMRNLEVFFDQKNNIDTSLLSKTPNFSNCFNKACENKSKLNYDLKRTIFNDKNTIIEEKYKLLKDLQRNELMNRALGRGIFSCNKYFDDEKRALEIQKRNQFEKFLEESKEKLMINLRTNEDFFDDKKKSFVDSQKFITNEYLPVITDDSKKVENKLFKDFERFRTGKINKTVENLYKPQARQRINHQVLVDKKMDNILKKAQFKYEKPYAYLASNIHKDKVV